MKTVYVAQAYGGLKENEDKAREIVGQLNQKYQHINFISPVLAFGNCYNEIEYNEGLAKCLDLMLKCDELLLLDGWESSKGATEERRVAAAYGLPILKQGEYPLNRDKIFCIMGYQCAGKDTIARLLESELDLHFCVSDTTRDKRKGEMHAIDYYFRSPKKFKEADNSGDYLEKSTTGRDEYGAEYQYGLRKVEPRKGANVFVCDYNGYQQVKENFDGEVYGIFLNVKWDDERRLRKIVRDGSCAGFEAREMEDVKKFKDVFGGSVDAVFQNDKLLDCFNDVKQFVEDRL